MPNLGEMSHGGVRIGNKLKPILRRRRKGRSRCWRSDCHDHGRGHAFNEIPPESLAVGETRSVDRGTPAQLKKPGTKWGLSR